ncbi:cytochrome c1 [Methylocapsa sp. D3K7]|uniref:cytochrome c1 n=1 Tax=Methylocapsa sp. D3K7 TaxID=3041435 RepID=UPI00244EA260|nr:cytochrome c1 [Methylocapsa sp. D3K7]WGJ16099.1 cytochrome c1 [Methylocapsa sp. D3K7]
MRHGNQFRRGSGWAFGALLLAAYAGASGTGFAAEDAGGAPPAHEQPKPPRQEWTFNGFFGRYDQAQLQRGFQVYREVCSNCHSLKMVAFRNLSDPGGPGFSEAQVKALAAKYQIKDGPNDAGDMFERPGRPSDYFPWNFANPQAAVAALGALPPDMSLLAKARSYERGFPLFLIDPIIQYQEQGPDYIYALLNGYTNDKDPTWNEYMPGHKIAMPMPLSDGAVDYADGSPKTVPQYAKDVTAFLMWAAEPKLEERKRLGFGVLIFLVVYALLLLVVKKKIWHSPTAHPSPDTP